MHEAKARSEVFVEESGFQDDRGEGSVRKNKQLLLALPCREAPIKRLIRYHGAYRLGQGVVLADWSLLSLQRCPKKSPLLAPLKLSEHWRKCSRSYLRWEIYYFLLRKEDEANHGQGELQHLGSSGKQSGQKLTVSLGCFYIVLSNFVIDEKPPIILFKKKKKLLPLESFKLLLQGPLSLPGFSKTPGAQLRCLPRSPKEGLL